MLRACTWVISSGGNLLVQLVPLLVLHFSASGSGSGASASAAGSAAGSGDSGAGASGARVLPLVLVLPCMMRVLMMSRFKPPGKSTYELRIRTRVLSFSLYYMYTSVGTPLSRLFWHPPATLF